MTAVKIAELFNYSRPTLDGWRDLDIERLELASGGETMKLCGPAILVGFEGNRSQQLLIFNGAPAQRRLNLCEAPTNRPRE